METFGVRLKLLLNTLNIKQSTIADKIGKTRQSVNNYLTDKSFPDSNFFNELVAMNKEINLNWLITGRGQMFNDKPAISQDIIDELEQVKKERADLINSISTMSRIFQASAQGGGASLKSKPVLKPGNPIYGLFYKHKYTVVNTGVFAH